MIPESLRERRSIYDLTKDLPLEKDQIGYLVEDLVELVPDAFNMKSSRVVLAFGKSHEAIWDTIYDCFDGVVSREKIDSFKAGAGTILYFVDEATVETLQEQFPTYADRFPSWADQACGMLQISIWTALAEEGIGASVQHYNPVVDEALKKLFDQPASYRLVAQMPFGGIGSRPDPKEKEDISKRVKIVD